MSTQITLTLDNRKYNVLRCRYGFNRDVDYRGRPTTGMLGGDIKLVVESTDDDFLWDRLSGRKPRPVSGKLEIFDAEAISPFRTLEWYDGYIYAADEAMSSLSAMPMSQSLLITTKRLDINSIVQLDRRFPQTYGFWWEEYKEPVPVGVAEETSDAEGDLVIKDAYWMDEEGNEIRQLNVDYPVTLYIELENCVEGKEIELTFEDEDDEGIKKADCWGVVNANGFVVIENFKLESI